MAIQVRYFASLKERMGKGEDRLSGQEAQTVAEVWIRVSGGEPLPPHLLMAVNQEYATPDHPVQDGDEVAFFPPVTGG
ncbi:MAG: molybdopterin converting factor subunit 1 [Gammaproteobacteria bacterium]|nr:MAG: molybdopterin converting factor subunit 1 [Gammaproteobacteria bacterium]